MYRWHNNGGWNKSHGTVEKTPRIDSFEAAEVGYDGVLFASQDNGLPLVLDCYRDVTYAPDRDIETVEIWHPKDGWSRTIELSQKVNGYGGHQTFSSVQPVGSVGAICTSMGPYSCAASAHS